MRRIIAGLGVVAVVGAALVLWLAGGGEPAAAAGPASVKISVSPLAGTMLTDGAGRSLYLFTRDERNKSNCAGACAQIWPPLITEGAPQASTGAAAGLLGSTARADGSQQVTYNGWPLYYYAQDTQMGDVKGQNVNNVWFVVSPYGGPRMNWAAVSVRASAEFGNILTDASGRTLYLFTRDEKNKTNCADRCAQIWPPLLTAGAPTASGSATASLLGFIMREEGSTQVTYNGWPLYYYAPDDKPGDTKGQNVGGVWYVLSPAGEGVRAAVTPAALPRTGDEPAGPLLALGALLGAGVLLSGLWLRRRQAAA
ncbi:MAG: LPXTG cell wall anchor domain-containing protein [Chloroflexi bacterium]|nr:LPXTG cell wall anchor domain-containing protein [Chloroflexota bacterium]